MRETAERRLKVIYALSVRRTGTIDGLANEFGVSRSTIRRDLDAISWYVPFYYVQGRGGGIRLTNSWYADRPYLTVDQENLLHRLKEGVSGDDKCTLQIIIETFKDPRAK